jgi:hypothetical protein
VATATVYAYTGTEPRSYPQYLDVTGLPRPLEAAPGRSYAVAVVPGWTGPKGQSLLPVPPGDGRWASGTETSSSRKAVSA